MREVELSDFTQFAELVMSYIFISSTDRTKIRGNVSRVSPRDEVAKNGHNAGRHSQTGVIKFWGPNENGDAESSISLLGRPWASPTLAGLHAEVREYACLYRKFYISALLLIVVAILVSVKQRRGPKMQPHSVQQPSQSPITTPTGSIPNADTSDPQRWSFI